MLPTFECSENPSTADFAVVDSGIDQYNWAEPEIRKVKPLSVFARGASTYVVGGAVGGTWGPCCELQQLWMLKKPEVKVSALS